MSILETLATGRRGLVDCVDGKVDAVTIAAAMPAGVLIVPDGAGVGKLPTSAAEVAQGLGFLVYISNKTLSSGGLEWSADEAANYLYHGDIWVIVEEAVTAGDSVFVRHTASGGNTQLGACRNDSDTDTAAALPNCRFKSTTSGAGIAKVRVNLPGETADVTALESDVSDLDDLTAAMLADTQSYPRTATGVNTLLSSNADHARQVLIRVEVTTTFDDGDGTQPTFKIGKTGDDDAYSATALLTGATAGDVFMLGGALGTAEAVIVTAVAATGATSTGAIKVTVLSQISE